MEWLVEWSGAERSGDECFGASSLLLLFYEKCGTKRGGTICTTVGKRPFFYIRNIKSY